MLAARVRPKAIAQRPKNACRARIYDMVQHGCFTYFILLCILVNTVILAIHGAEMEDEVNQFAEQSNYLFTAIFLVEAILKLLGLGRKYFTDPWNKFDFIIALGSTFFVSVKLLFKVTILITMQQEFRALRFGRILGLFRNLRSLRIIYSTFIM